MDRIKFYTKKAQSIPECLGYPLDSIRDLMAKAVDMAVDYERECIVEDKPFNKPTYIDRFVDWIMTSTELDPMFDTSDRNFLFLVDLLLNDVMYKYEMTVSWWEASRDEQNVIVKYFGQMFGFYAQKRQAMISKLQEERGS